MHNNLEIMTEDNNLTRSLALNCLANALTDLVCEFKRDIISFLNHLVNPLIKQTISQHKNSYGVEKSNFLVKRIFPSVLLDVPSKTNEGKLTRLVIQEHVADKAGLHYDYRIHLVNRYGNKFAMSFVTRKGVLPDKKLQMIRTNDHTINWSDQISKKWFEIPEGYGKGKVRNVYDGKILVTKCNEDQIQFITESNEKVTLTNKNGKWLYTKSDLKDSKAVRLDKGIYSSAKHLVTAALSDPKIIWEQKHKGAHVNISGSKGKSVTLTSHRISVDGKTIDRTYNYYPELQTLKFPDGKTIFKAELVYVESGQEREQIIAGLSNALPVKSRENQAILPGKAKLVIFDVYQFDGKKVDKLPYIDRRAIYENWVRSQKSNFVSVPISSDDGKTLFEKVVSANGEGVVGKDTTGDFNSQMVKWKALSTEDCEIIDTFPGQNKLKGKMIGGFIVQNQNGTKQFKAGTGLTDEVRRDAYLHPDHYIGKIIEIGFEEETEKSVMKPRIISKHLDKNLGKDESDLLDYATGLDSTEPETMMYRLKSAVGWRKK